MTFICGICSKQHASFRGISFQCRCGVAHRSLMDLLTHIIRTHDGPYGDQAMRVYNAMYRVEEKK